MAMIRIRRGTAVSWSSVNPILLAGEQGFEVDTRRYKIGDGMTRYNNLEYYVPADELRALIDQALVEVGAGDNAVSPVEFEEHVNSDTPHPAYDNGPNLLLLYQNAKV